jgi:hypothetical protein
MSSSRPSAAGQCSRECADRIGLWGGCGWFVPGHLVHTVQASLAGRSPWGWRDAIVSGIDGFDLTVCYLNGGSEVGCFHHLRLSALVVGSPVRVHEGTHLLAGPFGWVNVRISRGVGAVPDPAHRQPWLAQCSSGIVHVSTGRAVAIDNPNLS